MNNEISISKEKEEFYHFLNLITTRREEYSIKINYTFAPLRECCQQNYDILMSANIGQICFESKKSRYIWEKERKLRITGSRCYSLYTYTTNKKPNWVTKAQKYFNIINFSNKYVRHGIANEPIARQLYVDTNPNCTIFEPGLLVSHENPWTGYSADGIVFESGKPSKLLEIKCPFMGKNFGIKKLLKTCKYLEKKNGTYCLKNRHAYYGQIQLGMHLFNLSLTDFCIYSSFNNSMYVINVKKDNNFIFEMLNILKKVYFDYMLHVNCLENI